MNAGDRRQEPREPGWEEQNQRFLAAALAHLAGLLDAGEGADPGPGSDEPERLAAAMSPPPALDQLAEVFGLSEFERSLLLLCAGVELDAGIAVRCARAGGREAPTFGLALARLPEAHWSALGPAAPLRRWRLLELEDEGPLTRRALRIDERILHFLLGVRHLDERLLPLVEPVAPLARLAPSHERSAGEVAAALSRANDGGGLPVIQLVGSDGLAKAQVAAAAVFQLGLELASLRGAAVPASPAELDGLVRLWRREAVLAGRALLLDLDDWEAPAGIPAAVDRLLDGLGGVLLISCRRRRRAGRRPVLTFELERSTEAEQRQLWTEVLGAAAARLNGQLEELASHFRLDAADLRSAAGHVLATATGEEEPQSLARALRLACRRQIRPRLDHLAQRIPAASGWEDLVLPAEAKQALQELAVQVQRRGKVHEEWGFAARGSRGLGITALFAGVSGTGKTLAAEVLARELDLDLYRIDLAAVVSKYIGETEKNLGQVFDAAEGAGVVLLFDEADALFGKRSEVKDSHDRYANLEISYLLQRMEAYRGLAILTSNMKSALDAAFLRRLRFVVEFAFPGPEERAEIWRRVFPPQTPTGALDAAKLARLNVAGGNIRNIALGAAFAAADEGRPVEMEHLLRAARAEYRKLEKPLSEAEIRGWLE